MDSTEIACRVIKALGRGSSTVGYLHRGLVAGSGPGSWDRLVDVVNELVQLEIIKRVGRDGWLELAK